MTTSTKQTKRKPARRAATPPQGGIGHDGHQISQIENSKITIGSPGVLGTVAAVAGVIGTVIAGVALDRQGRSAPQPQPSVSSVSTSPVWTRIVNSGSDGVFTYPQPGRGAHYPDGYLDGTVVGVVCQERHGEAVTDKDPAPGQPTTWAVWNKLANGRWIPDLWTTLPKNPGDTPPNGLPTC